jgi:hypothetical protein
MENRPDVVITFGSAAKDGIVAVRPTLKHDFAFFSCHHPNARYKTQEDLNIFAKEVIEWIRTRHALLLDRQEQEKRLV